MTATVRYLLFFFFAFAPFVRAQTKDIQITPEVSFKPVTVTATFTLPAEAQDSVNHADLFPQAAPSTVIWHWGELNPDRSLVHSESKWKAGAMNASAEHTYVKPGSYGIFVTVVDAKGRLIVQRSAKIKINLPVIDCAAQAEQCQDQPAR